VYFADPAGNNLELLTHSMPLPAQQVEQKRGSLPENRESAP
jgi:hypothetical protein